MSPVLNVRDCGAAGDGLRDDSPAIQAAMDAGAGKVYIPAGDYRIVKSLRVPSNTTVEADSGARVFLCGDTPRRQDDFLLTNADPAGGNQNITVTGGIWDGNNAGKYNVKAEMFREDGYSGAALNFVNVRDLRLEGLTVANPASFYIRVSRLAHFVIRDIQLRSAEIRPNQDGLHFGGEVRHGLVEHIRAVSRGQTNDDLIALNADDHVGRVENRGLARGDIEDVVIRDVYAEDCHTLVRLASVDAAIRGVTIEHIRGGVRCMAVNADALRYCKTPLFREEERPQGVGRIARVTIRDMTAWATRHLSSKALVLLESNMEDFRLENFRRDMARDQSPGTPTLLVTNVTHTQAGGQVLKRKEDMYASYDDTLNVEVSFSS